LQKFLLSCSEIPKPVGLTFFWPAVGLGIYDSATNAAEITCCPCALCSSSSCQWYDKLRTRLRHRWLTQLL